MKLIDLIKVKFRRHVNVDNFISLKDRFENARMQLSERRKLVMDQAEQIHIEYYDIEDAYTLNKQKIVEVKNQIQETIKENDEAAGERLFIILESLETSDEILKKAFMKASANKEKIDNAVTSLDAKIAEANANITSFEITENARKISKVTDVSGIADISNIVNDLEQYVKKEEWKFKAKEEVAALVNPVVKIETSSKPSVKERFAAYKAKLSEE
jgi:phage shock protein A